MMKKLLVLSLLLAASCGSEAVDPLEGVTRQDPTGCRVSGEAQIQPVLKLTRVLSGMTIQQPVEMMPAPGTGQRVYIVSQAGRIFTADTITPTGSATLWLNISARLSAGGEAGLLGLAFHPLFATNGFFYVFYTRGASMMRELVISRFTVTAPPLGMPDTNSERILLTIPHPTYDNHNGGQIAFGPDGFLYIGVGDGGGGGDPDRTAQDLNSLRGKVLRIDVNGTMGTMNYAIPASNPFVGQAGARGEIWAYGVRNPWRFSFDPVGGNLWLGDVGQGAKEEVDIIVRGGNYGWSVVEGDQCYRPMTGCAIMNYLPPVHAYPRGDGISISGGHVYRGRALPGFYGTYVFGDFGTGTIWGLTQGAMNSYVRTTLVPSTRTNWLAGFGRDADGELYAMDYAGQIHRLEAATPTGNMAPPLPLKLSETGCYSDLAARTFAPGILSYDVNVPLWSDNADKQRGLSLPPGGTIGYRDYGAWDFPVGTVMVKTFSLSGRPVETRLLSRGSDAWRGITYRWNAEGTDADLITNEITETIGGQQWYYPSRSDCLLCHTPNAGQQLGWQTLQMNRSFDMFNTGRPVQQIEALSRLGYFTTAPNPDREQLPHFPTGIGEEEIPISVRARAYLHTNCAQCHQPGGVANASIDLRATATLPLTNTCNQNAQENLGVPGAKILVPGNPDASTLLLRVATSDRTARMPQLSTFIPDNAAVDVLRRWISGIPTDCSESQF